MISKLIYRYIINESDDNTYYRQDLTSQHPYAPHYYFQHNTIYGVEIIYLHLKTNHQQVIIRNGDIVWFESILINPNDISKLTHVKIYIGGILIWNVPIDLIIKLCKPEIHSTRFYGEKLKITIPKKLFFNNSIINLPNPYELNGILLSCLKYHEVKFEISSTLPNIEYLLLQEFVYLNTNLMEYCDINDFKFSINQIYNISYLDKLALYNKFHPLCKFSSLRNFNEFNYTKFKLLNTMFNLNVNNVIPCVNYINTIQEWINTKIMVNVLILIILEYIDLQEIESNIINPLIIKDDNKEYLVFVENMDIKNGKSYLINYGNTE
jgi:hypothetical protein